MNTTDPVLTIADIEAAAEHPDWHGFGYIGERLRADEAQAADIDAADAWVLAYANAHRWSGNRLFTWLNSRDARHWADAAFSGNLDRAIGWNLLMG